MSSPNDNINKFLQDSRDHSKTNTSHSSAKWTREKLTGSISPQASGRTSGEQFASDIAAHVLGDWNNPNKRTKTSAESIQHSQEYYIQSPLSTYSLQEVSLQYEQETPIWEAYKQRQQKERLYQQYIKGWEAQTQKIPDWEKCMPNQKNKYYQQYLEGWEQYYQEQLQQETQIQREKELHDQYSLENKHREIAGKSSISWEKYHEQQQADQLKEQSQEEKQNSLQLFDKEQSRLLPRSETLETILRTRRQYLEVMRQTDENYTAIGESISDQIHNEKDLQCLYNEIKNHLSREKAFYEKILECKQDVDNHIRQLEEDKKFYKPVVEISQRLMNAFHASYKTKDQMFNDFQNKINETELQKKSIPSGEYHKLADGRIKDIEIKRNEIKNSRDNDYTQHKYYFKDWKKNSEKLRKTIGDNIKSMRLKQEYYKFATDSKKNITIYTKLAKALETIPSMKRQSSGDSRLDQEDSLSPHDSINLDQSKNSDNPSDHTQEVHYQASNNNMEIDLPVTSSTSKMTVEILQDTEHSMDKQETVQQDNDRFSRYDYSKITIETLKEARKHFSSMKNAPSFKMTERLVSQEIHLMIAMYLKEERNIGAQIKQIKYIDNKQPVIPDAPKDKMAQAMRCLERGYQKFKNKHFASGTFEYYYKQFLSELGEEELNDEV